VAGAVPGHSLDRRARHGGWLDTAREPYDEAFASPEIPRPHYAELLDVLAGLELGSLGAALESRARGAGVTFPTVRGDEPFHVDPVPRVLTAGEWSQLEAGLVQRVRALEAFVADVYGERRIVAAGRIPARAVEGAEHYDPLVATLPPPPQGAARVVVAGLDVVRMSDGRFAALEDNVRTPSGLAYMTATRELVAHALASPAAPPRAVAEPTVAGLREALRSLDPTGGGEPSIVLLSDGPAASAPYEHRRLAEALGVPLVTPDDLETSAGRLHARLGRERRAVDIVYRRTDEERLSDEDGQPTPLADLLLDPLRKGTLGLANAFGTGVADDKLIHAYVDEMVDFYLAEVPLLRSVPTYDLAEPAVRADALERLDRLVIKPRAGSGGRGVVIYAHASREDRDTVARLVRRRPEHFVAQEMVCLSAHPTAIDGRLEPRHVDLRPFVLSGGERTVVPPGGLTRFARAPGALVVNSSQSGGGKDTWVLE